MSETIGGDPTANEAYFDAAIRHAVDVRRFQQSLIKKLLPLLEQADRDLVRKIRTMLENSANAPQTFSYQRLVALLKDVNAARAELMKKLEDETRADLVEFAQFETHIEQELLETSIPIALSFAAINLKQVAALVERDPFNGMILKDWFATLARQDQERLRQALAIGMTSGETIPQIITRIIGTKAANYQDGILSVTRRNAEAIARTAVNSASNSARQYVWEANSDIIAAERWVSVLDGRTSAICRARDGTEYPVGVGPRPPAHWNCRSVMVAVLNGVGIIGERPYVVDTRRREAREFDFRAEAKRTGRSIQSIRNEWAEKNIGQTPAATTYQEWLKKQSAAFQDSVLGQTKGKLFRDGGLTVQQFVDRNGNELNLKQLREKYPDAWERMMQAMGSSP